MTKSENNKEEENDSFKKLVGSVKPLKPDGKVVFEKQPPKARRLKLKIRELQSKEDMPLSDHLREIVLSDDKLFYSIPDLPGQTIKDLKNGKIPYTATLDLHRKTVEEARVTLVRFLQHAFENEHRCVLIVHGRGKHEISPPILKNHVNSWLRQYPYILAFCSATPHDGGTGAIYVLLKNKNKIKA